MAENKSVVARFVANKEKGINRQPVSFDYQGLNWDFIKLKAEIAAYAKQKYGSVEQYAEVYPVGEQSPMNHIAEHMRQYLAREPHDKFGTLKHHLAAIAYNAMMEFYYLEHGGPTVTDKLYQKPEVETKAIPVEYTEVPELPEPPVHDSILNKFFRMVEGLGGGTSKGPL